MLKDLKVQKPLIALNKAQLTHKSVQEIQIIFAIVDYMQKKSDNFVKIPLTVFRKFLRKDQKSSKVAGLIVRQMALLQYIVSNGVEDDYACYNVFSSVSTEFSSNGSYIVIELNHSSQINLEENFKVFEFNVYCALQDKLFLNEKYSYYLEKYLKSINRPKRSYVSIDKMIEILHLPHSYIVRPSMIDQKIKPHLVQNLSFYYKGFELKSEHSKEFNAIVGFFITFNNYEDNVLNVFKEFINWKNKIMTV